jgi:Zn-dependent M28 family amino/carboxypeptidase
MKRKLALLAGALLVTVAGAAALDKDASPWWGHVRVLAGDDMQGRLTGSPGYRKAAEYVARGFQSAGLAPAGDQGYFQNVGFDVQSVQTARSRVHLLHADGSAALDVSDRVVLSPGVMQREDTHAPLVFAGYGIHLPEAGHDDFHGVKVRGAVVVYLVGGPASLTGAQRAHAYAEVLPHFLEASGAVGTIALTAPGNREVPWSRQRAAGTQPGMLLAEKALRRFQGPMFAAAYDESRAEDLFAGSRHTFAELVAIAEAHQPLPDFPLATSIDAHVETTTSHASSDNVVAEWPGSDPALAGEAVVISAHLDHLGTGAPDHGDGIFHGAMDDASGVASLLEIARTLQQTKARPRRSILLLAVCGEEKGLLGSRYFAAHPTRHAGHIVADINSDMFLPLYPLHRLVGFGAEESSLGDDLRAVAAESGVTVVPDPMPDHLVFVRSDQYSFVRKGVPSLMLLISPSPGTAEEQTYRQWFTQRYHAQADDLQQPVDLAAADAFDQLVYRLSLRIADAPQAPHWNEKSFFAPLAARPLP